MGVCKGNLKDRHGIKLFQKLQKHTHMLDARLQNGLLCDSRTQTPLCSIDLSEQQKLLSSNLFSSQQGGTEDMINIIELYIILIEQ